MCARFPTRLDYHLQQKHFLVDVITCTTVWEWKKMTKPWLGSRNIRCTLYLNRPRFERKDNSYYFKSVLLSVHQRWSLCDIALVIPPEEGVVFLAWTSLRYKRNIDTACASTVHIIYFKMRRIFTVFFWLLIKQPPSPNVDLSTILVTTFVVLIKLWATQMYSS